MDAYIFSVNQTLNQRVNTGSIWQAITTSEIVPALHSVIYENSQITINFESNLSALEVDTLTLIITNHDGNPVA